MINNKILDLVKVFQELQSPEPLMYFYINTEKETFGIGLTIKTAFSSISELFESTIINLIKNDCCIHVICMGKKVDKIKSAIQLNNFYNLIIENAFIFTNQNDGFIKSQINNRLNNRRIEFKNCTFIA